MKRRGFLSLCAVTTLTGCLGEAEQPTARLAWIWLQNDRDKPYEVDVTVEDDGDTVFSNTYEVGTEPDTANINEENPVDGSGQYVVRAQLDGETREVDTAEFVKGDENCIGVRFALLNNGSVDYWTKSMQDC